MRLVKGNRDDHHDTLVSIAKMDRNIRSFSSHMFSSDAAYDKGWIRVAEHNGEVLGFTCVRHKSKTPETMLYFVMVHPDHEGEGVGKALMRDLEDQTPHKRIVLKVMKDNIRAIDLYMKLGYRIESEDEYKGKGLQMAKEL